MNDEILTREETAKRLKITTRTLDNWTRRGVIPCLRGGRIVRFEWRKVLEALGNTGEPSSGE